MVAPTHNGRMAPPELLHAIYSIVNVQARLSRMASSRVEVPYSVTRRCITFCCAGVQRIELCRQGFWRPSGYPSLTPLDCLDLSRPAGLRVYQVVTG